MWWPWRRRPKDVPPALPADKGTVVLSDRLPPANLPPNFQIVSMDESPLPKLGETSGPDHQSLMVNLALLCSTTLQGQSQRTTLLENNPALRILKRNDCLFQVLCEAYQLGGEPAMRAKYVAINAAAEQILAIVQDMLCANRICEIAEANRSILSRLGEAARSSGSIAELAALSRHSQILGQYHYGNSQHTEPDVRDRLWQLLGGTGSYHRA